MRRNYFAALAWGLLIVEFVVPLVVADVCMDWLVRQGPGALYLAIYWLSAISIIGVALAIVAVILSRHGFGSRIVSIVILCLHAVIGANPVVTTVRLLLALY